MPGSLPRVARIKDQLGLTPLNQQIPPNGRRWTGKFRYLTLSRHDFGVKFSSQFDPGCVETLAEFRYDGRAGLDGWFFGFGYLSG
jgi:hypothetical protein